MRTLSFPAASLGAAALLMAAWLAVAGPASAAEHEIRMLNKGEAGIMVFEPAFLAVAPGDTVHFRAVDKGHNAASIDGMVPQRGAAWKGGLNKDVTVMRKGATSTSLGASSGSPSGSPMTKRPRTVGPRFAEPEALSYRLTTNAADGQWTRGIAIGRREIWRADSCLPRHCSPRGRPRRPST
jgi:plastocyanin